MNWNILTALAALIRLSTLTCAEIDGNAVECDPHWAQSRPRHSTSPSVICCSVLNKHCNEYPCVDTKEAFCCQILQKCLFLLLTSRLLSHTKPLNVLV